MKSPVLAERIERGGFVMNADLPAQRTPLNIKVAFKKNYAREPGEGVLKNLSTTGAFVVHDCSTVEPGEKLTIKFSIAGRERGVPAEVIWANENGCGVKFKPTTRRDLQIIDDLIDLVESKRSGARNVFEEIFKKVG